MADTLPAVAQRVYTDCKKCSSERYHVVLAHTSPTSAKVECEVCHSKKTYKLPKTTAEKVKKSSSRPKKSPSAESRKSSHQTEYNQLLEDQAAGEVHKYSMKIKFIVLQKVEHPKFGLGVIKSVQSDKIEVVFPDEIRLLVHNRPS
jgi:hypothetical protein